MPPFDPHDPRVKKTRRGLREAFIRLILQKGYDAITIQDIADEAETARVTFYRHYHDKDALLADCLDALYEELIERTEPASPKDIRMGISRILILYEHIQEQEELYRILFSGKGTQTVIERLRHHLADQVMMNIGNHVDEATLQVPLDLIAHHVASTQMGLVMWWLDANKPYTIQYMSQIALWLTMAGVARALGREGFPLPPPKQP